MKTTYFVIVLLFIGCTTNDSEEKKSIKNSNELQVFLDTVDGMICKQFMDSAGKFQKYRLFYTLNGNLSSLHNIKDNKIIGISDYFNDERKVIRRSIEKIESEYVITEQSVEFDDEGSIIFEDSDFIDYSINGQNYVLLNESKIATNVVCAIGNYSYDSIQVVVFKKPMNSSDLIAVDTLIKHDPEFYFEFDFNEKIKDNFEVVLRISTIKHWDDNPGKIGFIDYNINLMEERIAQYPNKYETFDYWNLE